MTLDDIRQSNSAKTFGKAIKRCCTSSAVTGRIIKLSIVHRGKLALGLDRALLETTTFGTKLNRAYWITKVPSVKQQGKRAPGSGNYYERITVKPDTTGSEAVKRSSPGGVGKT